jgi:hypothetical protein
MKRQYFFGLGGRRLEVADTRKSAPRILGHLAPSASAVQPQIWGNHMVNAVKAGSYYFRGSPQGAYLHTRAAEYIHLRPAHRGR